MANPYWRAAALSTGLLVIVLAIGMVDVLGFGEQAKFARAGSFIRIMRDAGLNQEDRQKQTVGYYEGLLNAGSRVTSYLLHYDPTTRSNRDAYHRVSGTITFRSPIDCVFLNPIGLFESDERFGSKGTVYFRGERLADNRAVEHSDMVSFSPDGRTLILSLQANSSADQIRIIMLNERHEP